MKPKILLVDDKLENIIALEETLANLEVEYIRALSGKEALRQVLKHDFALLIIDVQMPELNGYQTVELLRQSSEHKHLPVIFVSAIYSDDYYKIKGFEVGAIDFIAKPFAPEILRGKVYNYLELYTHKMALVERNQQLQQANAELARATRLKEEFFANMSHELRTPLNAILSMSELLTDGIYGAINEKQIKAVGYIDEAAHLLLSLITDILDLSKIEAGKMELKPQTVVIEDVCRSCVQMVKQIAMKKQISVHLSYDENVKTLFGDERAIKEILVNLLNNAVKFTPNKGKVSLELLGDEINRVVNISVIDTGIGIPAHELDKLFQPFVQIDSRLNRPYEGTGLGLALVYKLAKLHKGHVNVKSEVGKGSTFTVSLPWQESDKVPTLSEEVTTHIKIRHAGAVVLIAEDNEANIVGVETGLTNYGYQVIVTHNGAEAIERAKESKPAIILMDIQMPGMDGLEAIKQIRVDADKQLARTPIIAVTALAMHGDKARCFDAGATAYLSKPLNIKRLVEEIERQIV